MKKKKKKKKINKVLVNTVSDFTTAGTVTGLLPFILQLPPDFQTIVNLGLPALACGNNFVQRIQNDKIIKKDREKIELFVIELKNSMEQRDIKQLQNFISLNFPIEIYSVVEEIIKEGINAKGKWLRKLAAEIIVVIGAIDNSKSMAGKQLCLEILKVLNEIDIKLLLLYEMARKMNRDRDINLERIDKIREEVINELLSDEDVLAHSIWVSSNKLTGVGLVMRDTSLYPYDDPHSNKKEMIENFIALNHTEETAYYTQFIKYIHRFI